MGRRIPIIRCWSPDGTRLAVARSAGVSVAPVGRESTRQHCSDRTGGPIPSDDWSSDGKWIIYHESASSDLGGVTSGRSRLSVTGLASPLVQTPRDEFSGGSVAGRPVAGLHVDESGRRESTCRPFPPDGRKIPVSAAGLPLSARWQDDRTLYYWGAGWPRHADQLRDERCSDGDRAGAPVFE